MNIPRVLIRQIASDGLRVTFTMTTIDGPTTDACLRSGRSGRRHKSAPPDVDRLGAANARWSPDGSTIAFLARGKEPGQSIFLMPGDGGAPRQLSHHATGVSDIAWHPDGASIYFLANDSPTDVLRERERLRGDIRVLDEFRQRHLWKISVGDGTEMRITGGDDSIYAFKIAANGRRIIASRQPTSLTADSDRMELWSIGADGSGGIQLTRNKVPEEDGALAPDGSQVLFVARATERQEPYYNANLFLVPATEASAPRPGFPVAALRAEWAPDSKSI